MKVSKRTLLLPLLAASSAPALATDVDIYGKANVTVQSSDEGEGSFTEVRSNASRLGFKANHKFDTGLEAFVKVEFQLDIDGDKSDDNLKQRNQYVGVKGNFGEIILGKIDTALKLSQGKIDLFNDYNADIKKLWAGENRLGDSITYRTKKFNGFQLAVEYLSRR